MPELRKKGEVGMSDIEKVIKGLEAHATASGCIKNCPYWRIDNLNCSQELAADALALLKSYEPRVMTYEEVVEHYSLPPVFPDDLGMQEDYILDIEPLYFDFPNPADWDVHWRGANQVNQYLERWAANYGKTWRVWTGCPTDEQRRGMPWDERERSSGQNED